MEEINYEPNPMLQNIVKQPKKPNKLVFALVCVVVVLVLIIILLLVFNNSEVIVTETERLQSLDEVAVELEYFIEDNNLDTLDAYGYDEMIKVAIYNICDGIYDCSQIEGDAVEEYINDIFNTEVTLTDVSCDLNDGTLYAYSSETNRFTVNSDHSGHGTASMEPIYTKVNSIQRDGDKILLVLNKLYYNPTLSDYITTDPLGINKIYNANDYMHTTENGEDINLTKLSADYENNFDNLKNTGTRYSYTFAKENGHYILEKYTVLSDS